MPILTTVKGGSQAQTRNFSIEHAQNLLDLGNRCPPKTWKLDDGCYELDKDGRIVEKAADAPGTETSGTETSGTETSGNPA